jgi:hypothetical protein
VEKLERFMRSARRQTDLGSGYSSHQQSQQWKRQDVAQPCSSSGVEDFVSYFIPSKVTEEKCMVLIALSNRSTVNGDELYAINSVLKLLDDFVIIPSATLSSVTGTLLCWLTTWGFTKHYWIIAKWIATVLF